MPITVDEVIESAASGVLRALHARGNGEASAKLQAHDVTRLVQSGFNVQFVIRAGGPFFQEVIAGLNPQPLPPVASGGGFQQ